jgi:predicted nucleic acid-binding protein
MNILVDAGFLIALCDPNDQYKEAALNLNDLIIEHNCIVPWPILYETFRTQYLYRKDILVSFNRFIDNKNVVFFNDADYRDKSFEKLIDSYNRRNLRYSLVDYVIREIITDINVKIDYFVTFNPRDFADVCALRKIEILSS